MGLIRGVITAVLLVSFVSLVVWAWSARRVSAFDAAARAPLEEDDVK